jgi:acyl-CoA thioesterase-1
MRLWRITFFMILVNCVWAVSQPPSIMFIGDSLTAGFQLNVTDAYPAIIQHQVGTETIQVINAGVSGDTTFSVLDRLDITLQSTPNMVFLCIGANDGLRGISPDLTKKNITTIVQTLKQRNIAVILAGMSLPKNYSQAYIDSFETIFRDVAKNEQLPFMPFLLKDVVGVPTLNLNDRIHPNKNGHKVIAKNVLEFLKKEQLIPSKNL